MISLRPFWPEDEQAVISLWQACGLTRPWNDPTKDIARKLTVQPELFLVAERDGRIVGTVMAGYDGHRGWVNYLAVDPAMRHQGLGRLLMNTVAEKLAAMGCPKINLQILRSNLAATAFYNALGYGEDDAISMGKRLISDE